MIPNTSTFAEDTEWLALIQDLRSHKHEIVLSFLTMFDGSVVYEGLVPRSDIVKLVEDSIEMYLILLAGKPLPPQLRRLPRDLGVRRAQQGVAGEQLLEGVRTNSRVLWNALQKLALADRAACLVRNTATLLQLVEWHVGEVQHAYLLEVDRLERQNETHRRNSLNRLFHDDALDESDLTRICSELGISSKEDFELVLELGAHGSECVLCKSSEAYYFHVSDRTTVHFRSIAGALGPIPELPDSRAAHIPLVHGAGNLGLASRVAQSLLAAHGEIPPGHIVTAGSAWRHMAWKGVTEQIPEEFLPIDLSRLRSRPKATRERLLETARTYMQEGSIKRTSELLYCHRNTVVKRITQVEELLSLQFSVPADAALIAIALSSFEEV